MYSYNYSEQNRKEATQKIMIKRYLCITSGIVFLALGIIGIFIPLLPTTPFLLLSAALFFQGSPRLYQWLLNHKQLGPYIRNFREERSIPLRAKILSISLLWITCLHCIFFLLPACWMKLLLGLIAIGVTCYLLSFKTKR